MYLCSREREKSLLLSIRIQNQTAVDLHVDVLIARADCSASFVATIDILNINQAVQLQSVIDRTDGDVGLAQYAAMTATGIDRIDLTTDDVDVGATYIAIEATTVDLVNLHLIGLRVNSNGSTATHEAKSPQHRWH